MMTEEEVITFCNRTLTARGIKARVVHDNAELALAVGRAIRRCELIDALRNDNELAELLLVTDNPDFNMGANCVVMYTNDSLAVPSQEGRFEGETLDECLEEAHRWLQSQNALRPK